MSRATLLSASLSSALACGPCQKAGSTQLVSLWWWLLYSLVTGFGATTPFTPDASPL